MIKVVAIEGGLPEEGFTHGTPVLVTETHAINPISGHHLSLDGYHGLKELADEGAVELLPTPIEIPEKYSSGKYWMRLMVHEHGTYPGLILYNVPSDVKTDIIEHWKDNKYSYTLFETDEGWENYTESVITRTVRKTVRPMGANIDETVLDGCFILNPHHPIINALYAKIAPPERADATMRLAVACLRGREEEFYQELANPLNKR